MSEYVVAYDMWVTQAKLPPRVRGFCKCINGENCAIINEDLSDDAKREAVEHEVKHIRRGDLSSDEPVEMLED